MPCSNARRSVGAIIFVQLLLLQRVPECSAQSCVSSAAASHIAGSEYTIAQAMTNAATATADADGFVTVCVDTAYFTTTKAYRAGDEITTWTSTTKKLMVWAGSPSPGEYYRWYLYNQINTIVQTNANALQVAIYGADLSLPVFATSSITANADLLLTDCLVHNGRTLTINNGGCINVQSPAALGIYNSSIYNCTATASSGGALYAAGIAALVSLQNTSIVGCAASVNGGGIYVNASSIVLSGGVTIATCSAALTGGGIYTEGTNATLNVSGSSNTVIACSAFTQSGGVYAGAGSVNIKGIFTITGSICILNSGFFTTTAVAVDIQSGGVLNITNHTAMNLAMSTAGTVIIQSGGLMQITLNIPIIVRPVVRMTTLNISGRLYMHDNLVTGNVNMFHCTGAMVMTGNASLVITNNRVFRTVLQLTAGLSIGEGATVVISNNVLTMRLIEIGVSTVLLSAGNVTIFGNTITNGWIIDTWNQPVVNLTSGTWSIYNNSFKTSFSMSLRASMVIGSTHKLRIYNNVFVGAIISLDNLSSKFTCMGSLHIYNNRITSSTSGAALFCSGIGMNFTEGSALAITDNVRVGGTGHYTIAVATPCVLRIEGGLWMADNTGSSVSNGISVAVGATAMIGQYAKRCVGAARNPGVAVSVYGTFDTATFYTDASASNSSIIFNTGSDVNVYSNLLLSAITAIRSSTKTVTTTSDLTAAATCTAQELDLCPTGGTYALGGCNPGCAVGQYYSQVTLLCTSGPVCSVSQYNAHSINYQPPVCTSCVAGTTYCNGVSAVACSTCSASQFVSTACTTTANTGCGNCVAGTNYCNGVSATACTNPTCTSSQYGSECTATANSLCTSCPANNYCNGVTATACSLPNCTSSQYRSACTPTANSVCLSCPSGFDCDGVAATASTTSTCTASQYRSAYNATSNSVCTDCPSGFYCNGTTATLCSACDTATQFTVSNCTVSQNTQCAFCNSTCLNNLVDPSGPDFARGGQGGGAAGCPIASGCAPGFPKIRQQATLDSCTLSCLP